MLCTQQTSTMMLLFKSTVRINDPSFSFIATETSAEASQRV